MRNRAAPMGLVPAALSQLPWRIIALVLAIGGFGLLMLFSAADGSIRPWAAPQAVRFIAFMGMAVALSRVKVDHMRAIAFPGYGVVLFALLLVELLGAVRGGSQRWLDLGIIRIQPSEFMKPLVVLAAARLYEMLPPGEVRRLTGIWPAAALIVAPVGLVMLQPDLGTALMIGAGGTTVMFLAGVPLRLFIGGALGLAVSIPLAINFVLHDYQRNRILTFLDPESDPLGTGYHISQSKIAIGSGGFWGKGFLHGTQSHLDYLPEGHTDFALATLMEEWGLIGGLALIVGYFLLIFWGLRVALNAPERFARLTAAGLATTIFLYVGINMSMVMGLAPVVGIPLPLVSFGGSAQMTVLICFGILMAIDRSSRRFARW